MKRRWLTIIAALFTGGAITLIAFVLVDFEYGAQASLTHMELVTVLGAALGGVLVLI
jgi:hypothetical protein